METRPLSAGHLRIARATDSLNALLRFYRDGLGFDLLARFEDHDGYDGVMLGHRGAPFHLEFTRRAGDLARRAPNQDALLVFYAGSAGERDAVVARMAAAGFPPVPSANPYWDRSGVTFEDPDGYRVVVEAEGTPTWIAGPGPLSA